MLALPIHCVLSALLMLHDDEDTLLSQKLRCDTCCVTCLPHTTGAARTVAGTTANCDVVWTCGIWGHHWLEM